MGIGSPSLIGRVIPGLATPRLCATGLSVLFLAAAFIALSTGLRFVLSDNLLPDDAELTVAAQTLHGGYSEQPPLYTWMLWAVFQVTGPGLAGLSIVRSALLLALVGFTYLTAKLVVPDRRLVVPLAFSALLLPAYGWHAVTYLTHSVLLGVAVMATVYAVVRVLRNGAIIDYALLGAAIGVGALAKYNFPLVVLAAIAAGLSVPAARKRLLTLRMFVTAAVAVLILLPHLVWLANWWDDVFQLVRNKSNRAVVLPYWEGVEEGLWAGVVCLTVCVALVVPLLGWLGRGAYRSEPTDPAIAWLGRFLFALLVIHIGLVFVGGVTFFQDRWLQPLLLPLPLWYLGRFVPETVSAGRVRLLNWLTAGLALAVLGGQTTEIVLANHLMTRYDARLDYAKLARELEEAGHAEATFISWDREILGNLRPYLPDTPMWYPAGVEAFERTTGPVVVLWDAEWGETPPWVLTPDLAAKFGTAPLWPARLRTFTLHSQNPAGRSVTLFVYRLPKKLTAGQEPATAP